MKDLDNIVFLVVLALAGIIVWRAYKVGQVFSDASVSSGIPTALNNLLPNPSGQPSTVASGTGWNDGTGNGAPLSVLLDPFASDSAVHSLYGGGEAF